MTIEKQDNLTELSQRRDVLLAEEKELRARLERLELERMDTENKIRKIITISPTATLNKVQESAAKHYEALLSNEQQSDIAILLLRVIIKAIQKSRRKNPLNFPLINAEIFAAIESLETKMQIRRYDSIRDYVSLTPVNIVMLYFLLTNKGIINIESISTITGYNIATLKSSERRMRQALSDENLI